MLRRLLVVISFLILWTGVASALEFSADMVVTEKSGHIMSSRFYSKADKMRSDMKSPQEMTIITRMDKKVVWNVMPKQKMYMEMPFDMTKKPKVEEKMEGEIERKQVGTETIDRHPTKKFLITYRTKDRTNQVYQWMATDINFPVKTSAVDGSWSQELKNIKMGSQPDSLFEVPSGYQKLKMQGGMNIKGR